MDHGTGNRDLHHEWVLDPFVVHRYICQNCQSQTYSINPSPFFIEYYEKITDVQPCYIHQIRWVQES